MSNTSNASKNVRRFLLLFALGVAYGFMYVMPYMKSSFYDQMIAAMGCTNAQLGSLMTYYTIALTISYLPGGWIGDKFNPKPVLLLSIFGQAALSFLFMFTYQSYTMAVIVWLLMALTGGFAFWPAIMKGIRMTGTDEEQGRIRPHRHDLCGRARAHHRRGEHLPRYGRKAHPARSGVVEQCHCGARGRALPARAQGPCAHRRAQRHHVHGGHLGAHGLCQPDEGYLPALFPSRGVGKDPDARRPCRVAARGRARRGVRVVHAGYLVAKLSMDNALYYVNGEYDKVKAIRNGVNA